jgi:hypothetical protein
MQYATGMGHIANNEVLFAPASRHASRHHRRLWSLPPEDFHHQPRQSQVTPKFVEHDLPDVYRNAFEYADRVRRVRALAREWFESTAHFARVSKIRLHPNFQNLVNFGPATADWALEQLRRGDVQYHWLLLLKTILGIDPTAPEHVGRASLQAKDWLEWHDGVIHR